MTRPPFLPYARQAIDENDLLAVSQALQEEWITRGPLVELFEQEMAAYCQAPYAVAFNSGTAALMAAYFAADLKEDDCVVSTPNSFIATILPALQKKSELCFLDIERSSGNLNLLEAQEKLSTKKNQGRLFFTPVHFAGRALPLAQLQGIVKERGGWIIEDAAHALGSQYLCGRQVGSCAFSDMTVFSFHPAKIITTGEGGLVTTRLESLYHRLRLFRNNGIEKSSPYLKREASRGYYEVQAATGNYNFTSFQAALGLSQLKRIEGFVEKRRKLVRLYRHLLKEAPYTLCFDETADERTAFHLFVVQIDFKQCRQSKEAVMEALEQEGIGSQIHYIPLYHHPQVSSEDKRLQAERQHEEMEIYYRQALSLPLYSDLQEEEVARVCHTLMAILKQKR